MISDKRMMSDMTAPKEHVKESVYQYLFFLYNGEVTVIGYEKHGQKRFRYEKREGETHFPISDDFWDWWRKAAAYINGEPVDFCFLFDNREYSILSHDFLQAENTCWTRKAVEDFFTGMQDFSHISLISENGREVRIDKADQMFADNTVTVFYTNIPLESSKKKMASESGDMTPFARYFRELLEEQNATKL